MRDFSFLTISGRDGGFQDSRDVLVNSTTDGVDLNTLWTEFQQTVAMDNASRQAIINFISFPVTRNIETVAQLSSAKFERSSEYGEPRGMRQKSTSFSLGYDFGWYDLAARYTWQFLADADASQVEANHNAALDGHNRLVFELVLSALYTSTNRETDIDGQIIAVKALYNADGVVPPAYKSNVFDATHTHYLVSGAAAIESGDLDDLFEHLRHHGYDSTNGVQQIIAVNSREGKVIRKFRVATGATYDFIPALGQPQDRILDAGQQITGGAIAATYNGLRAIGSYGELIIVEDDLFPAGYVLNIGSGGSMNLNNPVGIREHANASLRGLRLVKGRDGDYPLIDSFYNVGLGTGIRQRGGSAVMQIKATGTYAAPAQYLVA